MLPILLLGCLQAPTTMIRVEQPSQPAPLVVVPTPQFFAYSTAQHTEWLHGTFTLCTETPCGHLDQTTWNNREVYVKPSGLTSDPSPYKPNGEPSWFWAYIFEFSPNNWAIQYVRPDLRDDAGNILWNAYQSGAGNTPVEAQWENIQMQLSPFKEETTETPQSTEPSKPESTEINQTLFIQAPTIRIRKDPNVYAEILTHSNIGETVVALQMQDDWIEVQDGEHTGWVHAPLLSSTKPTLERSLQQYYATTKDNRLLRQTWLEQAHALDPNNTMVLQLLLYIVKDSKDTDYFRRVLTEYQNLLSDKPIFFTNESFTDGSPINHLELIPSLLSCRTMLQNIGLEHFSEDMNPEKEWKRTLSTSEFWPIAQQYCVEFQEDRTTWELIPHTENGYYTWTPATITPTLQVTTNIEEPCTGDKMGTEMVQLTLLPSSTKTPLLYLSQINQPADQIVRLNNLSQLEAVHIEEKRVDNNTIRREYLTREDNEFGGNSVFIESEIGVLSTGEFELQDALLSIKLGVQWNSGSETILYGEEGFGKYSYFQPAIGNIIIADFQNDGGTDFLFSTGSGGSLLIETSNHTVQKIHTVVAPMPYPVGGC